MPCSSPGDAQTWQEAAVFVEETEAAVRRLPERLAALATDRALLSRKQEAVEILWRRYGLSQFTYDIRP